MHVLLTTALIGISTYAVQGQNLNAENPVFVNDSPTAADTFLQVDEHLAATNLDQAVKQLQRLLDEQADALVPRRDDPSCFAGVRAVAHGVLKSDPGLLARYRRSQSAAAEQALKDGEVHRVERSWLLTRAGFSATLVLVRREIEAARFDSALLLLRQLEDHPDLNEAGGVPRREAVSAAKVLARYLPRAAAVAERLSKPDPLGDLGAAIPAPAFAAARSPLAAQPRGDLSGIVAQPLASAAFSGPEATDPRGVGLGAMAQAAADPDQGSPFLRELRYMPTLMGDALYVPTANGIVAFDRYTLTRRWGHQLKPLLGPEEAPMEGSRGFRRRAGYQPMDDLRTVTAGRSVVLVMAASEPQDQIDTREAVAAFDPVTGRNLWATHLREVREELKTAHVRGPIMLDPGGTQALIAVRKDSPERRLRAFFLAALDAATGKPAWSTLVGSVGIMPYQPQPSLGDAATLHEGVLYASDRIGIACAYEAATGRPLWVRRLAGETFENPLRLSAWQSSEPIIDGDRVLVFSPDRRSLLALDRATGREISRTPAPRAGIGGMGPIFAYIIAAEGWLVYVGDVSVAIVSRSNPAAAPALVDFESPGIRGRVTVVGDRLLVPLERSLAVITLSDTPKKTMQQLDEPGNTIFVDDQLIVADDARVHSYLSWESASRVLAERIAERGSDPGPGVALAELAYRSNHDERILQGVDAAAAAIGAIGADGPDDYRLRLIASLRTMIDAAQNPVRGSLREPLKTELLSSVIDRLGGLSRSATEQAAVHLVRGKYHEDHGTPEMAAASYQAVLDDPSLCGVMWQGTRLGIRADTEATRRLEQLVARAGRGAYARFDSSATAAVGALAVDAPIEDLERLARRYPVSVAAPRLWARVAEAHARDKRDRLAARALEIGLQTAERIPGVPMDLVSELAGQLVSNLLERGLAVAAEDSLRRIRATFGEQLVLTREGRPLDSVALLARISADRAQFARWPALGAITDQAPQVLPGWVLMEQVVPDPAPHTVSCLALRHQDGRIALFARGAEENFAEVWSAKTENHQAQLLRLDRSAATFYTATAREGGSLTRVDASTGRMLWTTEPFATHFPPAAAAAPQGGGRPRAGVGTERVATPLEGMRAINEVIFNSDERTLAMVERGGRGLVFDADSGQRLWAATLPLPAVYDTVMHRNLLAVAGEADAPAEADREDKGRVPQIVLLDARTGDLLRTVVADSTVRWIRFMPRGELVAGLTRSVVAIDPETGSVLWTNSQPRCQNTLAAWTVGDSLFVQSDSRQVWMLTGGVIRNDPVDTRDRLDSQGAPRVFFSQSGDLAWTTPQGLALVSSRGNLLGTDASGSGQSFLPAVATRDGFVLLEAESVSRDRAAPVPYLLHRLDNRSAKLMCTTPLALSDPPARLAALDGRLAISTGAGTVVLSAPAEK